MKKKTTYMYERCCNFGISHQVFLFSCCLPTNTNSSLHYSDVSSKYLHSQKHEYFFFFSSFALCRMCTNFVVCGVNLLNICCFIYCFKANMHNVYAWTVIIRLLGHCYLSWLFLGKRRTHNLNLYITNDAIFLSFLYE